MAGMQLPFESERTCEESHSQVLRKQEALDVRPVHKDGRCLIQRHGVC